MQEGDTAAVRGINGKDQKPIVQSSQRELAPKGFISPPKNCCKFLLSVPLNIVTYYDDDLQTGCRLPYLLLIRRGLADYRPSWVWLALTLHDTLHSSLVEDTPTQRTHTNSHSLLASNSSVLLQLHLWDILVLQENASFAIINLYIIRHVL